LLDEE
jgi:hypothetical protein